jgi:LPXTG-motif cell wall-anchored protein
VKRVLGILTAVLATCALGVTAVSPASAYPPATALLTTPTSTVTVGSDVTLRATGFASGAVVSFAIESTLAGTVVANTSGAATLVASSPPVPGVYTVTASSADGRSASFELTVLAAGAVIPATGSDSSNMVLTAGVLVLVGAGLLGAAAIRRRSRAIAAA